MDCEKTREMEQERGGGLEREREKPRKGRRQRTRRRWGYRGRRSTAWLTNRGSLQSQADEKERRRKGEG